MNPDATVDARGLKCPLPLIRAKQRMAVLGPGNLLLAKTTDPEAPLDFAAWCEDEGHELVAQTNVDGGHETLIRKGA